MNAKCWPRSCFSSLIFLSLTRSGIWCSPLISLFSIAQNEWRSSIIMYSHDLNGHCEICSYSRCCGTKELKAENNSALHSLFSLSPTTYWWASSCILGNQWLKRFHRVSAWLRVIWQIYELCWTGSKYPENDRHSARWVICKSTLTSSPRRISKYIFPFKRQS